VIVEVPDEFSDIETEMLYLQVGPCITPAASSNG
jgi:hypothetical protein